MRRRRLLLCALISLLGCSCAAVGPRTPAEESPARYFQRTIAELQRTDPGSPALLNVRLAYGDYLLGRAPGHCAQRVVLAQEQLGSAAASLKARALYPGGWARAADLEYRIQLARATCGGIHKDALLAAVAAAHRAADAYHNAFDYRAMVIMQFNAAVALHRLGEASAAIAALESALEMDRDYGFADDARDNYKLLLTWRGQQADAAQVARLMRDFPKRRATLKYGWHPTDARVTLEEWRDCLEDGGIVRSRGTATYERHITAAPSGGWSVSYTNRLTGYEPGVWPLTPGSHPPQLFFPPLRFPATDFNVSATGELERVVNSKAFADRLTARTNGIIKSGAPAGAIGKSATNDALDAAADALSPGMLEAETTETYQLETAMWIGASLEQGVWYQLSAPLALPGLSGIVLQQQVEFTFTRRLPCAAGEAEARCVEIVMRATPDEKAVRSLLADINRPLPFPQFRNYQASILVRIVVDPTTLLPYTREELVYWYASFGREAKATMLEFDHLVSTASYTASSAR